MSNQEIIVEKYGTSSVTGDNGVDIERLDGYVDHLAELHGIYGLIIVASGSIAVGKTVWDSIQPEKEYPCEQTLAMLGSAGAFSVWQNLFAERGIAAGQLLISHREMSDRREGPTLRAALHQNIDAGIVTVANENNATGTVELKRKSYGGDNDGLASHIARFIGAKYLIFNTDKDGVLASDGSVIKKVTIENIARACRVAGGPSDKGTGGMYDKVKAAHGAARKGTEAFICKAGSDLMDVISGEKGSHFVAKAFNSVE